jgi:hypothetical protein
MPGVLIVGRGQLKSGYLTRIMHGGGIFVTAVAQSERFT